MSELDPKPNEPGRDVKTLGLGELIRKYGWLKVGKVALSLVIFAAAVTYGMYLYESVLERHFGPESVWPVVGVVGMVVLLGALKHLKTRL